MVKRRNTQVTATPSTPATSTNASNTANGGNIVNGSNTTSDANGFDHEERVGAAASLLQLAELSSQREFRNVRRRPHPSTHALTAHAPPAPSSSASFSPGSSSAFLTLPLPSASIKEEPPDSRAVAISNRKSWPALPYPASSAPAPAPSPSSSHVPSSIHQFPHHPSPTALFNFTVASASSSSPSALSSPLVAALTSHSPNLALSSVSHPSSPSHRAGPAAAVSSSALCLVMPLCIEEPSSSKINSGRINNNSIKTAAVAIRDDIGLPHTQQLQRRGNSRAPTNSPAAISLSPSGLSPLNQPGASSSPPSSLGSPSSQRTLRTTVSLMLAQKPDNNKDDEDKKKIMMPEYHGAGPKTTTGPSQPVIGTGTPDYHGALPKTTTRPSRPRSRTGDSDSPETELPLRRRGRGKGAMKGSRRAISATVGKGASARERSLSDRGHESNAVTICTDVESDRGNGSEIDDDDDDSEGRGPPKKKAYIPSYVQEGEKCVVCDDDSTGTHYRAMTCEGCKGFFRRTIQNRNQLRFSCKFDSKCVINKSTRNQCQFCRFRKCLDNKMDPDSVMNDNQRTYLRQLIDLNRENRQKRLTMALTDVEIRIITVIGARFQSIEMSQFFRFFTDPEVPDVRLPSIEDVMPSLSHFRRFVESLPGIETAAENDLYTLAEHRLIDVAGFRLAYCFCVETGELVLQNARVSEAMLEQYPWMTRIYKFAKFYAQFITEDGILLGVFAAIRFFCTDNIALKNDSVFNNLGTELQILFVKFVTHEKCPSNTIQRLMSYLPNFETIRIEDDQILIRLAMLHAFLSERPDDEMEVEVETGEPDKNGVKEKICIQRSPYVINLPIDYKPDVDAAKAEKLSPSHSAGKVKRPNSRKPTKSNPRKRAREDSGSNDLLDGYASASPSISSHSGETSIGESSNASSALPRASSNGLIQPIEASATPVNGDSESRASSSRSNAGDLSLDGILSNTPSQRRPSPPSVVNGVTEEQLATLDAGRVPGRVREDLSRQYAMLEEPGEQRVSVLDLVVPSENGHALDPRSDDGARMLRARNDSSLVDVRSLSSMDLDIPMEDTSRLSIGLNQQLFMDHLIMKNRFLEEKLQEYARSEMVKELYQEQRQRLERDRSLLQDELLRLRQQQSQRLELEEQLRRREMQALLISQKQALSLTMPSNGALPSNSDHIRETSRSSILDVEGRYQPSASYSHEMAYRRNSQAELGGASPSNLSMSDRSNRMPSPPPMPRGLPQTQPRQNTSILSILQNQSYPESHIKSESLQPSPRGGVVNQTTPPQPHVVHLSNSVPSQAPQYDNGHRMSRSSPSRHSSSEYRSASRDISASNVSAVPYTYDPQGGHPLAYRQDESHPDERLTSHRARRTGMPTESPPSAGLHQPQDLSLREVVSLQAVTEGLASISGPNAAPSSMISPPDSAENGSSSSRRGSFSSPSPPDQCVTHRGLKKRWLVRHTNEKENSKEQQPNGDL